MASIEEINGFTATFAYKLLGYSSEEKSLDNSILSYTNSVLKMNNLHINYTEQYFYEEFWFYFITIAELNAVFPIIQFSMNQQLTPSELAQTNVQDIYTTMRNLAFAVPRDRTIAAGIDITIIEPGKAFEEFNQARFKEYQLLIRNRYGNKQEESRDDNLIEAYVYHLSMSINYDSNPLTDELVKMAFRFAISEILKNYFTYVKELVMTRI